MTDFDYIQTRNKIIAGAFRVCGVLDPNQNQLTAEMLDQGIEALQLLVKSWSNKHLFLWAFNQTSFATVISQAAYDATLDQAIIGLDKAWIVESNDEIPIEVVSYSRYLDIVNKTTNSGRPIVIAYKPTPAPSFYLWPKPDAVYTMKALCVFALKDFDTADGTGNIPVRYQRALKYGLAEDLFDEYPGPMNERQYVQGKAATLFSEAKNSDMPVETTNEVEGLYGNKHC